jgi:hypothetical protein
MAGVADALGSYLGNLITDYAEQKKELEGVIDATKRQRLAADPAALALYDQTQAVKSSANQFAKIKTSVKGLGEALSGTIAAFAKSTAMLVGFTAAANPQAAEAMGSIFRIVSAQLGIALMPVLMQLVVWAGNVVDWFKTLSPTTQTVIASLIALSPAIMSAIQVGAGKALGSVFGMLGKGVMGLLGGFTLLAGAGLVVAGALLYFTSVLNARAESMKQYEENAKKGVTEGFSRKELEGNPDYARIQNEKDPAKQRALSDQLLKQRQHEMSEAFKEQQEASSGWFTSKDTQKKADQKAMDAEKQMKITLGAKNELVNKQVVDIKDKDGGSNPEVAGGQKMQSAIMMLQGVASKVQKEQQPKFGGLEEARKQIQINALKDPLEQELLRLQREYAKKWLEAYPAWIKKLKESGGAFAG